ncbi:MAG: hypothetical protein GY910_05830 [bacterium]|nr:hypothetical protein [Deltaproteobacteria bacterium]MCP4904481.1 hypothetical protein [bacterium]
MSIDPVHEEPHASDDPAYCETWAYGLTDLERRAALLVHASWLPARGVGNHLVTLQRDGYPPCSLRVESHEPLRSSLFEIDVEPWRNARVRCPELSIDLEFSAFTPPIDFGGLFSLAEGMNQRHVQAGVRASGRIGSEALKAVPGFRDRSWGPRDMRHMGRLVALLMTGIEEDLFVTVNSITHRDRAFCAGPDTSLGCCAMDGEVEVFDKAPIVLRNQDGTPACFEFANGIRIDLDLADAFQEGRFLADRTSTPDGFPTSDPILMIRLWALAAKARGRGRVAGSYQEGHLFTN